MAALAPADADMFFWSRRQATDQFLLYCFAAQPDSGGAMPAPELVLGELESRARRIGALAVRVSRAPGDLALPRWTPAPAVPAQFRHHPGALTWDRCRTAVARTLTDRLDATDRAWRVHLYGPVGGAPGGGDGERVWVAALQISHALADGRTASALARELFGGPPAVPAPPVGRAPGLPAAAAGIATTGIRWLAGLGLGLAAWRTGAPAAAAPPPPIAATPFNGPPGPDRAIDAIVVPAARLRADGASITVAALLAVGEALSGVLDRRDPGLAVELTLARDAPGERDGGRTREPRPRNDFHTVTVGLHPQVPDRRERARRITADIAAARARDGSARRRAERRAAAVTPAVLRALAVRLAAGGGAPGAVAGAALVSSVNRGPADLTLAGGRVLFTAGFPALSAAHATTIGVHGIGDTVTVSVTWSPSAVPDADRFVALLRAGLAP